MKFERKDYNELMAIIGNMMILFENSLSNRDFSLPYMHMNNLVQLRARYLEERFSLPNTGSLALMKLKQSNIPDAVESAMFIELKQKVDEFIKNVYEIPEAQRMSAYCAVGFIQGFARFSSLVHDRTAPEDSMDLEVERNKKSNAAKQTNAKKKKENERRDFDLSNLIIENPELSGYKIAKLYLQEIDPKAKFEALRKAADKLKKECI